MADLRCEFAGIHSPNPFWLASAPPTDKEYNVRRAFDAGWGGAVWKTLGLDPPIVNVGGPRYGAIYGDGRRVLGFNNIELISDRPLADNLEEIARVKRDYPDRAVVASLMAPCEEKCWQDILRQVEQTGADGVELNFGCPHGMNERGMGSAVGQVPDYVEMVARWCKANTSLPVIVKLTPNVTDIVKPAAAARKGGADAVSLINTLNSIVGVDLRRMTITPATDGKGAHGGYCGPAVKPIALHMVADIKRKLDGCPISAIGGIGNWRDAAEFIALGAANVQVCTAAMVYGFKIIEEMRDGLANFMDENGYQTVADFTGRALPSVVDWRHLNLNYAVKAEINQDLCIKCGRCHIVCEDASHQAIAYHGGERNGGEEERRFVVKDEECVGCNLCAAICPIDECITMRPLAVGETDLRTGKTIPTDAADWTTHPNNPPRE